MSATSSSFTTLAECNFLSLSSMASHDTVSIIYTSLEGGYAPAPRRPKPEMTPRALAILIRLLHSTGRACHHKVQELALGLMWNLAARDATMQHRMARLSHTRDKATSVSE
jgi:hypothetical protein